MKSVVILGSAHPLRGGLASYNERLAQAFQDAGDQVQIYTFSLQYPNFLFPGKTQYSESPAPKDLNIRISVNSVNPINWLKVGNEISKQKPDLLIFKYWLPFMGPCFGTIARRVKRNGHTKIITILDNVIPHEHRPGDRLFTRYFLKPIDAFIAMSTSVLEDLGQFNITKPRVESPHPLFDNFGKPVSRKLALSELNLDPSIRYLLFFGFIRDYKGLDLLLHAMAEESMRNIPVKLIIAGEFYSNEEKYRNLISELNLEDRIIDCTNFIADEEVYKYFCAADVVVQPYKNATQSGVTQIGYQFEKPMIVTNVGGLPEIIPDGKVGFVVEPNSKDLAVSIARFYNENKLEEFTANAREEKKKYSWEMMVQRINNLCGLIKSL